MTRRFRWTRPLSETASVTVTRVAGDHEHGTTQERRYTLDLSSGCHILATSDGAGTSPSGDARQWVTVSDGAGLAWVRVGGARGRTRLFLPGPSFDSACTNAIRGDEAAGRAILAEFDSAVEISFACGPFLGIDSLLDLFSTVVAASEQAADTLHATRYDVLRAAATTPAGPTVGSVAEFETFVDGLDAIEAVGDVAVVDALADTVAVGHDSAGETRAFLEDLGYDLPELVERGDGRFFAHLLAQIARTGGVRDAKQFATRAAYGDDTDYDDAKARAQRVDYWDRGAAWRAVVRPAASRSREEFAYVLANALYWTGEVGRSDSRGEELLHQGAVAVSSTIDLDWITAHARFEQCRATAHRHRSSGNHAQALRQFERAIALAEEYTVLDAWEPTYSHAIVRSNQCSAAGDHERAVSVVEDAVDALADREVPADRYEEMVHHLRGQAQERRALRADDDPSRLAHLEAALDHYEAVAFDRSVDRIEAKLADAEDSDGPLGPDVSDRSEQFSGGPQPTLRPEGPSGPSLSDIPDLHDFLTAPDSTAVGSADPGVLPDEQQGLGHESTDGPRREGF